MKLYYNVSNTNNMKNGSEFNHIVHSNIMELIMLDIRNNMILAEPSAPYILGENSQINNTHESKKYSVTEIIDITGLSKEEIEKLIQA